MSHVSVCSISIKNPNLEIIKKALSVLAQELGSKSKVVEDFLVRGWSFEKKCPIAIEIPLPYGNGYGIYLENGELKVIVDDHGAPLTAEEFSQKLVQYYVAVAIAEASKKLGFNVNIQQLGDNIVMDLSR